MFISKQTFKSSIAGGFFEFFLIVLGVTIALWLENVAEEFKEREIEQQYLIGFQNDVRLDIIRLNRTIKYNQGLSSKVEDLLSKLISNQLNEEDLFDDIGPLMNYDFFSPNDFTLTSIRESGDFRLLRDTDVKLKIIQLKRAYDDINSFQNNFQKALDDQIVPMFVENVNMTNGKLVNPEFLTGHRFANIAGYTLNDINTRIKLYQTTIKLAESFHKLLQEKTGVIGGHS